MKIDEQLRWERECIERGSEKYYSNQDKLREMGQLEQSDVISHLFKERLEEVAEEIKKLSNKNRGAGGAFNKLLKVASYNEDYLKMAYIGTQCAFHALMTKKKNTLLKVCLQIGTRLEADLKCTLFQAKHPVYYQIVQESFKEQKVSQYNHKHKVMMKKFNEFEFDWGDWTYKEKVQIAQRVLQCILKVFDDVIFIHKEWAHGKSTYRLETTTTFDDWAAEFERERGFMFPVLLPLKIPPKPWDRDSKHGGYYTPRMSAGLPFIKTKGKSHKDWVNSGNPEAHRKAINKMQRTAWAVNKEVLEVQQMMYDKGLEVGLPSNVVVEPPSFPDHLREVPKEELTESQKEEIGGWKTLAKAAYARENQRKGQVLAYMQINKLARELSEWDEFYYAYNCDFRGRIYCATTGLSPQGSDNAKGLLRFARGVELGKDGVKWLAVQGANTFGVDKVTFDDRTKWVRENEQNIHQTINNPVDMRDWWGNADKPYQFLAFCFEWAKCDYGRDISAKSYIPVGLDGSCNGLQHYSAMLRDPIGAKATNLVNSELPQDIYQEVADVTTKKLRELEDEPYAAVWLRVGIDRKCAKRPVMTLPYGATQQSARQYILEYVLDNWHKFQIEEEHQWGLAKFLTPILWEAIGEVVVAAREGMSWIQQNVGKDFAKWYTPIGFPVYQYYKVMEKRKIYTQLNGSICLRYRDINDSDKAATRQQRNGIAPNFVHSIDSTHMVVTLLLTDLSAFAMIHDDFGTHAGNTEKLYKQIRKAFKWLYEKHDPLQAWADQMGINADLPTKGTYKIEEILQAQYFFS